MTQKTVLFMKSHVDAYTRSDGVVVQAHESGMQATRLAPAKIGKVHYLVHPKKGHLPGKNVMVPHPDQSGKKVLGKYMGQHDGDSVIHHEKLGSLITKNDHVSPAHGVPAQDPRAMARAAEQWHAENDARNEAP
jgi:hypothetical protein